MYTIVQLKGIIGQLKADWTTKVLNFLIGRLKCIIANRISKKSSSGQVNNIFPKYYSKC